MKKLSDFLLCSRYTRSEVYLLYTTFTACEICINSAHKCNPSRKFVIFCIQVNFNFSTPNLPIIPRSHSGGFLHEYFQLITYFHIPLVAQWTKTVLVHCYSCNSLCFLNFKSSPASEMGEILYIYIQQLYISLLILEG